MSKVSKAQKAEFQMAQMEPSITSSNQTMSSREIAELTGKQHKNVLRDIKEMEPSWVGEGRLKFELTYYTDQWNRQQPEYQLTKIECLYIATKYNDSMRAKLIIRWEELENKLRAEKQFEIPQTLSAALLLASKQALQIEEQAKQIEEQKPKVLFAEAVAESKTCILVGELAKLLKQNGLDIGQNRMFEYLRNNGYLHKSGLQRNLPTQKSINDGLFKIKEKTFPYSDGTVGIDRRTVVTGKGQQYFFNKFSEELWS